MDINAIREKAAQPGHNPWQEFLEVAIEFEARITALEALRTKAEAKKGDKIATELAGELSERPAEPGEGEEGEPAPQD